MGDGFGIDRVRRRDWVLDDEPEAEPVGAPKGERHAAGDSCTEFPDYRTHDFDRCVFDINPGGLTAPFMPSTLHMKRSGEQVDFSPSDVRQGRLGDCHLLAPLAALASTPEGRAVIEHAISERKNANGEVVGYSVQLYERSWRHGWALTPADPIEVRAGTPYVVGHATAQKEGGVYEIWPLVIEQAYAKLRGGYNVIGKDDDVWRGMEAVTGKPVTHYAAGGVPASVWSDPHAVVVLSTRKDIAGNAYGLTGGHAYALKESFVEGRPVLQLYNPWGTKDRQPAPVPLNELTKWFTGVDVGSTRGTP